MIWKNPNNDDIIATARTVGVPGQKKMGNIFKGKANNSRDLDLDPDQLCDNRKCVLGSVAIKPTT